MTKRVAVYVRVSTVRQAVNDVSIPDQIRQAEDYCQQKGWELVEQYIEAGASATNDRRPAFQRMIADACVSPSPYDIILVHSLSRFSRDAIDQGLYKRKLEQHDVLLKSMTQDFGEGAQADLISTIIGACDQHQSAETAKHVSRSMIENARQGFWNGARPPLGYVTYVSEKRGEKAKKKLKIDPKSSEIVKLIFSLYLEGIDDLGPMGIKSITDYLNRRGYKTATGSDFYIGQVHKILGRTSYMGMHYYNQRDNKTGKLKSRDEWVPMAVPVIIEPEIFQRVQDKLASRKPEVQAPRISNSKVLLTGAAYCESCGSPLMLTTGKSGRYRYYSCSGKHLKGDSSCERPIRVPEQNLDQLVSEQVAHRVLAPSRLKGLVGAVLDNHTQTKSKLHTEAKELRRQLRDVDRKLDRLFDAVSEGVVTDSSAFRRSQNKLEAEREELMRLIAIKDRRLQVGLKRISTRQLELFGKKLQKMLLSGPFAFRKEYLHLLVDQIEVGKEQVTIKGSKAALAASMQSVKMGDEKVPNYIREWRTSKEKLRTAFSRH
ncbi:MAG: recombinase family protein [Kordiimonas sp.]|nr:recombinase family protein [Kordiimonas sp.]|tara:strand:+ start:438 stop:2072 length:1635 start_codon:yes stop_codon:yes gene_type:complete